MILVNAQSNKSLIMNYVISNPCGQKPERYAQQNIRKRKQELAATKEQEVLVYEGGECCESATKAGYEDELEMWIGWQHF